MVHATLICETESQKGILVGKGGEMIRRIGTRARPQVEEVLGGQVYLELRVKVRPPVASRRSRARPAGGVS